MEPDMAKRVLFKSAALLCVFMVFSVFMLTPAVIALDLENVKAWYWTSDTYINSVAVGDVDADFAAEIVTGGWHYDGVRAIAQLCVWSGSTLTLESVMTWYWGDFAEIYSVAIGDVDADSSVEIVTGGFYYDGVRSNAQLVVWSGADLTLENIKTWYWTDSTVIYSVAVDDVDGDGSVEIVTGGSHSDGAYSNAQLCVWDGSTLALEGVKTWRWTSDTYISSVVVSDVDGDESLEIVTGGYHDDGVRWNAQLCVWSGSSLTLENVKTWYWTDYTIISSVTIADVDGDNSIEIVTGGNHNDGTRNNAQLCVWDGATLAIEKVQTWYWTDDTGIYSVVVNDVDGDDSVEIVTGGYYWDGTRTNAQLCVWSGSALALEDVTAWYWTGNTIIYSVAVGFFGVDDSSEIVTGGYFWDGARDNAQLTVWV